MLRTNGKMSRPVRNRAAYLVECMEGSPPLLASLVLTSAGVKRKVRHLLRENCGAEGLLRGLIDGTPVDHRAEDPRFGALRGGNLGEIVRKDHEIRVLAGIHLAFLPFLKLRVVR